MKLPKICERCPADLYGKSLAQSNVIGANTNNQMTTYPWGMAVYCFAQVEKIFEYLTEDNETSFLEIGL